MNPLQHEAQQSFDYTKAFRRNLGFISPDEQKRLRNTRIAVAGLGGVGGAEVQALARLGIGHFTIADLDIFEVTNFNRQMGATMDSIGRKKTEVIREMILSINPTAEVTVIESGLNASNIDEFLEGANVVLDALDFNCFDERFMLYEKTRRKQIWTINVAPPGFGFSLFVFDPNGMTFEKYFDLRKEMTREEKAFALMFGIAPSLFPIKYTDRGALSLNQGAFPCVSPAFFLAAGIAATEAANLILKKRTVRAVPWVWQFDALLGASKKKYYAFGMQSPWQRFKKYLIRQWMNRAKNV